jgi:hypothetical protein
VETANCDLLTIAFLSKDHLQIALHSLALVLISRKLRLVIQLNVGNLNRKLRFGLCASGVQPQFAVHNSALFPATSAAICGSGSNVYGVQPQIAADIPSGLFLQPQFAVDHFLINFYRF